jgi:hypothetical protein
MMTEKIAQRLVQLCRQGDFEKAQKELYARDAVSIEPKAASGFPKKTKGLAAIFKKGKAFQAMTKDLHSITVSKPVVAKDSFACHLRMDITMKQGGRMDMSELCVYEVRDGKVISEQFHM